LGKKSFVSITIKLKVKTNNLSKYEDLVFTKNKKISLIKIVLKIGKLRAAMAEWLRRQT
jgi:hypothetical protein